MKNSATKLNVNVLEEFSNKLRGRIVLPKDSDYDEERKVYNGMIDKRPGIIAKCLNVADVIYAVNFARENNLLVAVRGGGHNGGGLGICDDGLVIDLSGLKSVRVDPEAKTVRVGGGNTLGEVDHCTHAFGLATPGGMISTTGVGGLTLGGGVGYLSRKYGLTIDNLISADMVLADGRFVTVNAEQNSDLYWAIRGGGGNFGIVTSFLFKAHDIRTVYGGPVIWELEKLEDILSWYHNFIHNAPDDLNGFFAVMAIPGAPFPEHLHKKKVCGIVWSYTGDMDKAEEVFKPIVNYNSPLITFLGEMPFPVMQSMFDGFYPPHHQWYWKGDFFTDAGSDVAAQHLAFGKKLPTPISGMHLYPISGAAGRVGKDETPWAYRDAKYAGVIFGVSSKPEDKEKISNWCKEYWEALHPYSSGGTYLNFIMDEGQERVKASYRQNYDRLVKIKKKYDPDNFFSVNQNIKPE